LADYTICNYQNFEPPIPKTGCSLFDLSTSYHQGEESMKQKLLNLVALCLFAGLAAGFIPMAASAQGGTNQKPQLLIKIRNIDEFLNNIEKLIPRAQGSGSLLPTAMARGMLQGTDWIDPQRSIVAGMVSKDARSKWVILIPFRSANPKFQSVTGAIAGEDYYLATFPPEPGFTVNPAIKESLLSASAAAATGSLVIEAAVGQLLDAAEPQLSAAMKNMPTLPQVQKGQSGMSPQESLEIVTGMLKTLRQAETLRFGLDLSGDILTLQLDIDARPNTPLASALIDSGGDSRLMNYPIDAPLQFRSRAYDKTGMIGLLGSSLGSFYRRIGLDFDRIGEMTKYFTGETASGMKISSDGFVVETISVLQPGINGEAFLSNTYLPWLENVSLQMSNLAAQQTGKPAAPLYKRTADSTVAGIKVMGVKANVNAIIPPEQQQAGIFKNLAFEMRIAAVGDMMFAASSDAKLESLITRSRGLTKSPAHGPAIRVDLKIGELFKSIQSLSPSAKGPAVWPDNLGNLTMNVEISNGKLATRTSFSIDDLRKLSEAAKSIAPKQASKPAGVNSVNPAVK
jgi:hypothetical protein